MGKKCLLLCFSGTGNTLLVGRKIQAELEKNGYEVTLYRYQEPKKDIPDPDSFDLNPRLQYPAGFSSLHLFSSGVERKERRFCFQSERRTARFE